MNNIILLKDIRGHEIDVLMNVLKKNELEHIAIWIKPNDWVLAFNINKGEGITKQDLIKLAETVKSKWENGMTTEDIVKYRCFQHPLNNLIK